MEESIKNKAAGIKLLILDVDGVMTDGSMIYDSRGEALKVFDVKDGLRLSLLARQGVDTVILTAKHSEIVKRRAGDIGIKEVYSGIPKEDFLPGIFEKYGVSPEEVCFMGDDLMDIETARRTGFSVAVRDACPELRDAVDMVTKNRGGRGAVSEVAELIMKSKGLWEW